MKKLIEIKNKTTSFKILAVKVGFVVCKGVFVAYIFYCTDQCAFI